MTLERKIMPHSRVVRLQCIMATTFKMAGKAVRIFDHLYYDNEQLTIHVPVDMKYHDHIHLRFALTNKKFPA